MEDDVNQEHHVHSHVGCYSASEFSPGEPKKREFFGFDVRSQSERKRDDRNAKRRARYRQRKEGKCS